MFKDSLCPPSFAGKGFSEVADWLRVQESLKWALVEVGVRVAHELNGKKIN